MNRRAYIFCLSILICGFVVAYICGMKMGSGQDNVREQAVNVNPQQENVTSSEGYWVKANDNKIFVYKSDGETMIAETGIDISEFSNQERSILENVVYLENAEELFKYLESNTS